MPDNPTAPPPSQPVGASAPASPDCPAATGDGLADRVVESAALLQGHKTVGIAHNGCVYRLQSTRLGKLILTK